MVKQVRIERGSRGNMKRVMGESFEAAAAVLAEMCSVNSTEMCVADSADESPTKKSQVSAPIARGSAQQVKRNLFELCGDIVVTEFNMSSNTLHFRVDMFDPPDVRKLEYFVLLDFQLEVDGSHFSQDLRWSVLDCSQKKMKEGSYVASVQLHRGAEAVLDYLRKGRDMNITVIMSLLSSNSM